MRIIPSTWKIIILFLWILILIHKIITSSWAEGDYLRACYQVTAYLYWAFSAHNVKLYKWREHWRKKGMARKWNRPSGKTIKGKRRKKIEQRKSKKYTKDIPIDTHTLKRMKLHHLITLSGIRNYRVVRSALLWILEKTWDLKQSLRYFPTLQFHTSSPLHFTDEKMRHKGVHWHSQFVVTF